MSLEFGKAEYLEPLAVETDVVQPVVRHDLPVFTKPLAFGVIAALIGSIGYALIGLSGFMFSIVAIAIGWLIAKAMMTGSGGIGGRRYQIFAAILTYFAVSCGHWMSFLWIGREQLAALGYHPLWLFELTVENVLIGPFLSLKNPNGALRLLICLLVCVQHGR